MWQKLVINKGISARAKAVTVPDLLPRPGPAAATPGSPASRGAVSYFGAGGAPLGHPSAQVLISTCPVRVPFYCRLVAPQGFHLAPNSYPIACFDLSDLRCHKFPIHAAGRSDICSNIPCPPFIYLVRLVGTFRFSASIAIASDTPGVCYPPGGTAHTCCSGSIPVDVSLTTSCSSAPCSRSQLCARLAVSALGWQIETDPCGRYGTVSGSVWFTPTGTAT